MWRDSTVENWEWIDKFFPHFIMDYLLLHAGVKVKYVSVGKKGQVYIIMFVGIHV